MAVVRILVQKHGALFDRLVDNALSGDSNDASPPTDSLRNFLTEAFVDAPYRAPIDAGSTLMLSLVHPSPTVRVQALKAFEERVPDKRPEFSTVDEDGGILFVEEGKTLADYQNATPKDMVDIIAAVCSCMGDIDPSVASVAWSGPVVKRVAIFAEHHQFVQTVVNTIEDWVTRALPSLQLAKRCYVQS